MITDIKIKNFRGIREFEISDAKRLNVIVGRNGTGKTALLEALFFAAGGSPELLVRTRGWRGGSMELSGPSNMVAKALWDYTFREIDRVAEIQVKDSDGQQRRVEIEHEAPDTVIGIQGEPSKIATPAGLVFRYFNGKPEPDVIRPEFVDGAVRHGPIKQFAQCHFLGARVSLSERETATYYSNLRVTNSAKAFEDALLGEFDLLKSLSVEAPHGSPTVFGEMKNGRRLPLSMISGGINHLAGILVRLASVHKSIVIIDEIENGFYHDRFAHIWRSVYELAKVTDSQIFASSHSLECLQALAEAIPEASSDVSFMRSYMDEEHEIAIEQMSGRSLFNALEIGEVR